MEVVLTMLGFSKYVHIVTECNFNEKWALSPIFFKEFIAI